MNRWDISTRIEVAVLMSNLITKEEAVKIAQYQNVPHLADSLIGSVAIDNFYFKKVASKIVLVYCMPFYEEIDFGDAVDTIGDFAFYKNKVLKKIRGDAVEVIGIESFTESSVVNVAFPNAKVAQQSCFYGCKELRKISLPVVECVERYAFMACSGLKCAKMSPSFIGEREFAHCSDLRNFDFRGVKVIQDWAFHFCNIEKVIAPSLEDVVGTAFDFCPLRIVQIPKSCNSYVSIIKKYYQRRKKWIDRD